MSKKRNDKESMICLTQKPSQKISEIIGVSLSTVYKAKKKIFQRELFKEKGSWENEKKDF